MAPVDAAGALIGLNAPGVAFLVAFATIPPLPPFLAYIVVVVAFLIVPDIVVFASRRSRRRRFKSRLNLWQGRKGNRGETNVKILFLGDESR